MPRTTTEGEKKSEKIAAKIPPSVKRALAELVKKYDRTESYVALAMIERGLAAYRKDGELKEPSVGNVEKLARPSFKTKLELPLLNEQKVKKGKQT